MSRYFYSLVFLFLLAAPVYAQTSHLKVWKDGPLTWDDFKIRDSNVKGGSELHYSVNYQPQKYKQQDTIFHRVLVNAYVDTQLSWVAAGHQSERMLRLNQLTFDIIELYRRQMQHAADNSTSPFELEANLRMLQQMYDSRIEKMRYETNHGEDLNKLEGWEQNIRFELDATPDDQFQLAIRKRNIGYGLNAGLAGSTFTGNLQDLVKPAFGLGYGFDFSYKRTILSLNGNVGFTKLRLAFPYASDWSETEKLNIAFVTATLGYHVLDNHRHRFTPFAGMAVTELSTRKSAQEDENSQTQIDGNLSIGLSHDFKIRKAVKLAPNMYGLREGMDTSINTRLYAARVNYGPQAQGYILNVTVSASFSGYLIKNPYRDLQ